MVHARDRLLAQLYKLPCGPLAQVILALVDPEQFYDADDLQRGRVLKVRYGGRA